MAPPVDAFEVLQQAAVFAGRAPSLHNSQPWRWLVAHDSLDLRLEAGRLLGTSDPDARLAVLSCGTALHHARIELAAAGWGVTVQRFPDPADAGHLARLGLDKRVPPDPATARLVQAATRRHTDRRSTPSGPLDYDKLRSIRAAIRREGTDLRLLRPGQVFTLARASDRARILEAGDSELQVELAGWVGRRAARGTGIPAAALPADLLTENPPGSGFRRAGTDLITESQQHSSVFAILHGPGDEPENWLTAGEALSAGWLAATELAVSVLPLSVVMEVAAGREMVQRLMGGYELPYLVLRFAAADPHGCSAARTPRLPSEETVRRHVRG
jgi:nitroreductase